MHHVPEFVQRFKTIGLLSEQGLEALHAIFNSLEAVFRCLRSKARRYPLLAEWQNISVNSRAAFENFKS